MIKNLCSRFPNVLIVDIENLGRRFYTRKGLHLNVLGKKYLCDLLIAEVKEINNQLNVKKINDPVLEKQGSE